MRENPDDSPLQQPKPSTGSFGGFFSSKIRALLSGKNSKQQIDPSRIQGLKAAIENDRQMCEQKKALLITNLNDQLLVSSNEYSIEQLAGNCNFDYTQTQRWNPRVRSQYQRGFFSSDDATGDTAIVDFANDSFGGGAVGPRGFAQEEKLLLETNLLSEAGEYSGLNTDPLYMTGLQTHRFVGQGRQIYGHGQFGSPGLTIDTSPVSRSNVDQFLQKVQPPKKVQIMAMAAIDMKRNQWGHYKIQNYKQMFETAYKSFRAHVDKGGKTVRTGAWGAGVFGNSENVACVIQILAAQAAGVQLVYHGKQEAYDSAIRFLKGPNIMQKSYENVFNSLCNYMQIKHSNKQFWTPQV